MDSKEKELFVDNFINKIISNVIEVEKRIWKIKSYADTNKLTLDYKLVFRADFDKERVIGMFWYNFCRCLFYRII